MWIPTIQPKQNKEIIQIYISETGEYYKNGEILKEYDLHSSFLEYVKINKFIKHKNYLAVNFNSLEYKTKNWTLNVDFLGKLYRKDKKIWKIV